MESYNIVSYPFTTNAATTITNTVLYSTHTADSLFAPQRVVEGAALPEDPLAWLRRRVDEVCWKPS
jgi:hypothetical protein